MATRTLQQILSELSPAYKPQIQSIQQRQAEIPNAVNADIQQAGALKDPAFGDILGGARRRGLGFSGIPLTEQAKYASDVYAPSVLKAQQSGREQALSLQDALSGIYERRNTLAQTLRQQEQATAENQRQFNLNYALQKAAQEESKRAASRASAFSPSYGTSTPTATKTAKVDPLQQTAYNDVYTRVNKLSDPELQSDYTATAMSARYGNLKDKWKLVLYNQLRPDLFKTVSPFAKGVKY